MGIALPPAVARNVTVENFLPQQRWIVGGQLAGNYPGSVFRRMFKSYWLHEKNSFSPPSPYAIQARILHARLSPPAGRKACAAAIRGLHSFIRSIFVDGLLPAQARKPVLPSFAVCRPPSPSSLPPSAVCGSPSTVQKSPGISPRAILFRSSLAIFGKTTLHFRPVHHIPPVRHILRAAVLILQVIGMFPDVNPHQRDHPF